MLYTSGQQLQQAYFLIKTGRQQEALSLLSAILAADRENADAWWLMTQATTDPNYVRQALAQLMWLRPDDLRARYLLDTLNRQSMLLGQQAAAGFEPVAVSQRPYRPQPAARPFPDNTPALRRSRPPARPGRRWTPSRILLIAGILFGVFGCLVLTFAIVTGLQWLGRGLSSVTLPPIAVQTGGAAPRGSVQGSIGAYQWRRGELTVHDEHHSYVFDGATGDYVVIEVTPLDTTLMPSVALTGPSGQTLASAAATPGERSVRLSYALAAGGTYTIHLGGGDSIGRYELYLMQN